MGSVIRYTKYISEAEDNEVFGYGYHDIINNKNVQNAVEKQVEHYEDTTSANIHKCSWRCVDYTHKRIYCKCSCHKNIFSTNKHIQKREEKTTRRLLKLVERRRGGVLALMTLVEFSEQQEQQQEERPIYLDYYLSDPDITRQKMPVVLKLVDNCTKCRSLLIRHETRDCK